MRYLFLIVLSMSLTITACSKKKSSSVATAPVTQNDDDNNNNGNDDDDDNDSIQFPAPQNGEYYVGKVTNIAKSPYKKFLKAGLGVYNDSGYFGDGYSYNWSYTCDVNIFSWIFGDGLVNCQDGQTAFNEYLEDIASSPAIVVLTIHSNGHVEGNWLVDAYQDFYGYIDYYMAIPFQGTVTELQDGRLMIEAGPLAFVMQSTTNALKHNIYFFDGNNDLAFGKITFK